MSTNSTFRKIERAKCFDGLVLGVWQPSSPLSTWDMMFRGFIYFLALIYLFVGVSIASDRFVESIEVITSSEKEVTVKGRGRDHEVIRVRVWNATVANLTLLALGTSTPEILISCFELFARNFESGLLGPGTILGSAAYNLFVIIALCISVIPGDETRKINYMPVFYVTAFMSIFAYIWLYLIVSVISPGTLDIWEGLTTLAFFPITVIVGFMAEKEVLIFKWCAIRDEEAIMQFETISQRGALTTELMNLPSHKRALVIEGLREYIALIAEVKKKYPYLEDEKLEVIAMEQFFQRAPKSRAFYRSQAIRRIIGIDNVNQRIQVRLHKELKAMRDENLIGFKRNAIKEVAPSYIFFDPPTHTVMEDSVEMSARVVRRGDISDYATVEYETENGTAKAGSDYIAEKGSLTFSPGVDEVFIQIQILDDDVYELDRHFFIRLFNPSYATGLGENHICPVMILDDDHCGVFSFTEEEQTIPESSKSVGVVVKRSSGSRGTVLVPYWTESGSAHAGREFQAIKSELRFENNETSQDIIVTIIDEHSYSKNVKFYVNLGTPYIAADDELSELIQSAQRKPKEELTELDKIHLLGYPKIGEVNRTEITIIENRLFQNTVNQVMLRYNMSSKLGTASWREQFQIALSLEKGGTIDEEDEEDFGDPDYYSYTMHFITLFWKLLFAFIPPAELWNGYLCFIAALTMISIITIFINDVASQFGCTVGIPDTITAITILAIGSSIPDTVASKACAINDKSADNSIGTVTGSNAVNVFMGIGVAWSIASIYHGIKGEGFLVPTTDLTFNVAVYTALATIATSLLLFRRFKYGAELGGPGRNKYIISAIFYVMYVVCIIAICLQSLGFVN